MQVQDVVHVADQQERQQEERKRIAVGKPDDEWVEEDEGGRQRASNIEPIGAMVEH